MTVLSLPARMAAHGLTETEIALARAVAASLPGAWSAATELDYDGKLVVVLIPAGDDEEAPSFHIERAAAGIQLGACRWDRFTRLGYLSRHGGGARRSPAPSGGLSRRSCRPAAHARRRPAAFSTPGIRGRIGLSLGKDSLLDVTPASSTGFTALAGTGEMARRVRQFDWSSTTLGALGTWPQSRLTAVGMMLLSPVPIVMLWGDGGRDDLQRRLFGVRRRPASRAARLQGARGLARGRRLQRQRDAGRPRRRDARLSRPGAHAQPPRPARAGLDGSRLLAHPGRERPARRRDGDRHRDHRARSGRRAATWRRRGGSPRCSSRRPASWRCSAAPSMCSSSPTRPISAWSATAR